MATFRGLIGSDIIGIVSSCGFVSLEPPVEISTGMIMFSYIKPGYDRVLDILQTDLEHVLLSWMRKYDDVFEEDRFFSNVEEISASELSSKVKELSLSWTNVTDHESETEAQAVISRRKGQEKYRQLQIELWEGKCALTGVNVLSLLNGSHAKAWQYSNDTERLDPYNGFLFEARIDRLFDKYLISFEDDGRIMISKRLDENTRKALGLDDSLHLRDVFPQNLPYLRYHRDRFNKAEELYEKDQGSFV